MWSRARPAAGFSQRPASASPKDLLLQLSAAGRAVGVATRSSRAPRAEPREPPRLSLPLPGNAGRRRAGTERRREAFWEALCRGASVGKQGRRAGAPFRPAPAFQAPRPASWELRAGCAFGRFPG